MKNTKSFFSTAFLFIILYFLNNQLVYGQNDNFKIGNEKSINRILAKEEIDSIFSKIVKIEIGIKFSIFRVYEYNDSLGKHYLVLTENGNMSIENPINDSIHGFWLSEYKGKLKVDWQISDHILEQGNEFSD